MRPVRLIDIIDVQRGPVGFRGILGLAHAAQNPDFTFHRRALCGGRQATHDRALHSASASAAGCGRVLPRISAASYHFSLLAITARSLPALHRPLRFRAGDRGIWLLPPPSVDRRPVSIGQIEC